MSDFSTRQQSDHGPFVDTLLAASMGLYSEAEILDRGLNASAMYEAWLEEYSHLEDTVAQVAILACVLDRIDTSGLIGPDRLLELVRLLVTDPPSVN